MLRHVVIGGILLATGLVIGRMSMDNRGSSQSSFVHIEAPISTKVDPTGLDQRTVPPASTESIKADLLAIGAEPWTANRDRKLMVLISEARIEDIPALLDFVKGLKGGMAS